MRREAACDAGRRACACVSLKVTHASEAKIPHRRSSLQTEVSASGEKVKARVCDIVWGGGGMGLFGRVFDLLDLPLQVLMELKSALENGAAQLSSSKYIIEVLHY